ncbi:SDR family oxidoreductase [Nocardioides sp. LHD-245]|uniref:SDR family NAD(P)-dependent oxidoreductase n=1 Tax=Nocardioides sp. LHD-245 TaxID=3051387 RepID=UPI0027E0A419|nr:SDR family oxidoreductase [Nocardioides sp. LHD-245]
MEPVLAGKVVVITGASRNIGAALAAGLARAGADLLLVARGREALESTAAEIRAETAREVVACVADVATAEGVDQVAAQAAALPRIDALVNNAAASGDTVGPLLEQHDAVWEAVLAANLLAPFRLSRALLPRLREQAGASILNVVSGSGFLPSPGIGAYGVSKAALWMMTRQLAVELAPRVRVNALCPGLVSPDGQAHHPAQAALLPSVPLGRIGRPEEMVGAARYLISDEASYTTGEVLVVNGGRPW